MTFVLAINHHDYFMLAADREGNSTGPTEVIIGSGKQKITVKSNNGIKINGIQKIFLSANRRLALGYAGTVKHHTYVENYRRATDPNEAWHAVVEGASSFVDLKKLAGLVADPRISEEHTLLAGFDDTSDLVVSGLVIFSPYSVSSRTSIKSNPGAILTHIGSGSAKFEEAVTLEGVNAFLDRLGKGTTLDERLAWLDDAFEKVSKIAIGCSANYVAVQATREEREFRYVRGDEPVV